MSKKKKKKEKIVYIDDGSTISDMSGLSRGGKREGNAQKPTRQGETPRWKSILQTYFDSVRMMLIPMFVVIAILCVVYLILFLAFRSRV